MGALFEFFAGVMSLVIFIYLMVFLFLNTKKDLAPRTLLIDDLRNIEADCIARNFDDGIDFLEFDGPWETLYLDHDLGDPDPRKTGYGIMCFLEANPRLLPKKILFVTSNPVGRKNMQVVLDKLYGENNERN